MNDAKKLGNPLANEWWTNVRRLDCFVFLSFSPWLICLLRNAVNFLANVMDLSGIAGSGEQMLVISDSWFVLLVVSFFDVWPRWTQKYKNSALVILLLEKRPFFDSMASNSYILRSTHLIIHQLWKYNSVLVAFAKSNGLIWKIRQMKMTSVKCVHGKATCTELIQWGSRAKVSFDICLHFFMFKCSNWTHATMKRIKNQQLRIWRTHTQNLSKWL